MRFKVWCVNDNFLKFLEYRSKVQTLKEAVELAQKDNVSSSNFKNFNNKDIVGEILNIKRNTPELISVLKFEDWNKLIIVALNGRFEIDDDLCLLGFELIKKSLFKKLQDKKSLIRQMKFLTSIEFYLKTLDKDNLSILGLI